MTYKALSFFEDLQDHGRPYHAGDIYPRHGYSPSPARIAELCGSNNKRGKAVIAPIEEPKPVQPVAVPAEPVPVAVEVKEDAEPAPKKRGRKRKSE